MTDSFHPPARTLMGPGPSDVSPRVLEALSRPTIGHLDPAFVALMDEIRELLQYAFRSSSGLTLPVSAPGSAGMEAAFANLLEPGDKAIVCQNGAFGARMRENVERCGATAVMVEEEWGRPVDPERVEAALKAHPDATLLAFVHAETSTGVRSDARLLCQLASDHGCLSLVDAVTSLGGIELDVDAWGIDAVYSGTQKCLSCVPGLSPVSFSDQAVERIRNRRERVQSWFLDMNLIMGYWGDGGAAAGKRAYHHTAPVNSMYALHESLLMLREEGLEQAWARHALNHKAFAAGIETLGLGFAVQEEYRLPQLNAILVPEAIDEARLRALLLADYGLEIGAGLGSLAGKIWRVGLMGYASSGPNVLLCLNALENTLTRMGVKVDVGNAAGAATAVYESR